MELEKLMTALMHFLADFGSLPTLITTKNETKLYQTIINADAIYTFY